jgi:gamma-glutamylcyclotransferase (GGCT)/AIG2-like uncharacterized protein YtfP
MTDEAWLEKLIWLNRLRRNAEFDAARLAALEDDFERDFNASCQLAVYGSLAPGRINHHMVADIEGQWMSGLAVQGELIAQGWGADLGYPALKWMPEGTAVSVQLLISSQLPAHWSRLDEFEGAEYQRILVPVYRQGECLGVANLYEKS